MHLVYSLSSHSTPKGFSWLLQLMACAGTMALVPAAQAQATSSPPTSANSVANSKSADDETIKLDAITVTSTSRSPKAIDHIPGSINLITSAEISHQLQISQDPT